MNIDKVRGGAGVLMRWRLRLRLAREFVALSIACLSAWILAVAMHVDEDTVVDFLKGLLEGLLEKAEDE